MKHIIWCAAILALSAPSHAARSETCARIVATYHLGDGELRGITMDEANGSIYIAGGPLFAVFRVDVGKKVTWTPWDVGLPNAFLAPADEYIWVNSYLEDTLFRVDTANDGAIDIPDFPNKYANVMHGPLGVQVMDGVVWVAFHDGRPYGSVARLNPRTMETLSVTPLNGGPNDVVATPSGVWVSLPWFGHVERLDPNDGHPVADIAAGGSCGQLAVTESGVYIASSCDVGTRGVRRIDPATNELDPVPVYLGSSPVGVTEGFGSLWVTDVETDELLRIDPRTRQIIGRTPARGMGRLKVGFGSLWGITWKGDLLRLQPDPAGSAL